MKWSEVRSICFKDQVKNWVEESIQRMNIEYRNGLLFTDIEISFKGKSKIIITWCLIQELHKL